MDEPVRWVTKAEAAEELEISFSTLDRKIRQWRGRGCQGGPPGLRADAGAGVSERRGAAAPGHRQGRRASA